MGKNKDFIGQSDSWASWLQRIKEIIDGDRTFWGWTLMTFVSSFIAPIKSILGLPLTIILFTGAGAAIFLIVSLLWKEFNHKRELKKEEESSDIKLNCDRAKEIDGILIRATNSKPVEQIQLYNQAMILMRDFPEIKKQRTIEVARKFCGENVTQEQQSTIYTLLEKYEPFRDKVNEILATKGLEAIKKNLLSKQSVEFLSSITDKDLESLKKQFKYVLKIPHEDDKSDVSSQDLAIWLFENDNTKIQNLLIRERGLFLLESYHIKFYGNVWLGEGTRISTYILKNSLDIIDNIDSNGLFKIQIAIKEKEQPKKGQLATLHSPLTGSEDETHKSKVQFAAYVCLGDMGMEIFNLLKDELEPTPSEYLNELIVFWSKANPQFDFKLISEPKLITDDNT